MERKCRRLLKLHTKHGLRYEKQIIEIIRATAVSSCAPIVSSDNLYNKTVSLVPSDGFRALWAVLPLLAKVNKNKTKKRYTFHQTDVEAIRRMINGKIEKPLLTN
ncbi:Hypothetical predicted protein [Cloeon dipterum]|uniref:Uncharacterized protein n=1 Tax=Cloeon dipterum TaxID=197152 RepID=A0A8S1CPJ9_9INSE|nr:Hypothetical predicted protein [Cloeon dipterum]